MEFECFFILSRLWMQGRIHDYRVLIFAQLMTRNDSKWLCLALCAQTANIQQYLLFFNKFMFC
jgi:hypothetical protein